MSGAGAGAAATGVTSFSGSSDQVSGEGATYCGLPLPPGSPPDSAIHDHLCYTSGAFKLYIGDIQSAMDPAALQQRGVTHIINCCTASCGKSPAEWAPFPHLFRYGFVFSSDSFWAWGETLTPAEQALIDAQNPSSQWHAVLLLLEECRAAGGSALVHCHWGINRSVTTAAVFMAKCGVGSFDACVEAIKGARPQAGPLPQYQAWGRKFCEAGFQTPAP